MQNLVKVTIFYSVVVQLERCQFAYEFQSERQNQVDSCLNCDLLQFVIPRVEMW